MTAATFSKSVHDIKKASDVAWGKDSKDILYWDPMGYQTGGAVRNLTPAMYEKSRKFVELYNKCLEKEMRPSMIEMEMNMLAKSLDTADWTLPIYAYPGVEMVNPGITPFADLIPRRSVNRKTIQVTPMLTQGEAEFFTENGVYPEVENTYGTTNYTWDVKQYGMATTVSTLMEHVGVAYANPLLVTAQAHMRGIRMLEEKQMIQGTAYAAAGFDGIPQMTGLTNTNKAGAALSYPNDFMTIKNTAINAGANINNLMMITDYGTQAYLANSIQDFNVYEVRGNGIEFSFDAITYAGIPVMPSHGAPTTTTARVVLCLDMSVLEMDMVLPASVSTLAKTKPSTSIATEAIGCLVSRAHTHHVRYYNIK